MPSYSGTFTLPAQMQAIAAGTWTGLPPPGPSVIGEAFGGGYYAGQIGVNSVATHYLIVGPLSSAYNASKQWKNAATTIAGANSVIDGPQNTADMVSDGSATVYPAAHFCNNLTIGGYTDWYLPARMRCRFAITISNPHKRQHWLMGINPNAVPARTGYYTAGNPGQTSAAIFQTGGSEAYVPLPYPNGFYWSSTQSAFDRSLCFTINYGGYYGFQKTGNYSLRAIRRVAV
jgi:hypothetical protein